MPHSQPDHAFTRALGFSIALHIVLAGLLIARPSAPLEAGGAATGASETMRVAYLTIERRPRPRVPVHRMLPSHTVATASRASAAPHAPPERPAPHPRRVTAMRATESGVTERGADGTSAARTERRVALTIATAAPERAVAAAPVPDRTKAPPSPTPADPTAAPSAAPQVADAAVHGSDVPPGGWGQSFEKPLVADEAALADLRSHYHTSGPISVDVDESGHALHVVLPAGLTDDARAELERRLRDLRYVPAECNGLRCAGSLQISL